jgi:hypothetical protein
VRQRSVQLYDQGSLDLLKSIDSENMVGIVDTALAAAKDDPNATDKAHNRLFDLKIAIDQVIETLTKTEFHSSLEDIGLVKPICQRFSVSVQWNKLKILEAELRRTYAEKLFQLFLETKDKTDDIVKALRYKAFMFDLYIQVFYYIDAQKFTPSDTQRYQKSLASGRQSI